MKKFCSLGFILVAASIFFASQRTLGQIEIYEVPADLEDLVQAYLIGQGVLASNEN
ncbi:MAG: hypothetical protein ACI84C_002590 [Flavobacteriales bacterium]|jgi:hypothetical protein